MRGSGDYHKFLVTSGHQSVGIFAEIAAVGFLAVDEENRILDLAGPCKQRLIHETLASDDIPSVI